MTNTVGRAYGPDANSLFDAKGYPLPAIAVMAPQPAPPTANNHTLQSATNP